MTTTFVTVKEHLAECFSQQRYDGSYHGADGFRTPESEEASESFRRVSFDKIQWSQVHGDFKDPAKRVLFTPYPHWAELYDCCRLIVKANIDLNKSWSELTGQDHGGRDDSHAEETQHGCTKVVASDPEETTRRRLSGVPLTPLVVSH